MEFWKPKEGETVKIRYLPSEEPTIDTLPKYFRGRVPLATEDCPFCKAGIPRKKMKQIK